MLTMRHNILHTKQHATKEYMYVHTNRYAM